MTETALALPFFETFKAFLEWLTSATGGAYLLVAGFSAFILERMAWWQKISKENKLLYSLAFAIAIGLGAKKILDDPELLIKMEEYFPVVMYSVMAWLTQQGFHFADPKRKENNGSGK